MTDTTLLESGVRDGLGAVKDVDEGKRQVLVDIPWEVIDSYNTDFARDCFDDFLGQRMPAMCWCHDKKEPIGAVKNWQKGERANEFVAEFSDFDAVPRSRQAFSQIKDGHLTDFSFYYDQAKAAPHPQTRGALRFSKARMPEISPVVVGSIPGAIVTGVREAADAAGVAELVRTKVITAVEGRAMLGIAGDVPELTAEREQITVVGARDDVSTSTDDDPDEVQTLAGAVDAALDQAADLFAEVDEASLPEPVRQAMAFVAAAGVTADALLDVMGIPDPDEVDDGGRSAEGERAADRVYHFKHGWIPLDHAAVQEARDKAAERITAANQVNGTSAPRSTPQGQASAYLSEASKALSRGDMNTAGQHMQLASNNMRQTGVGNTVRTSLRQHGSQLSKEFPHKQTSSVGGGGRSANTEPAEEPTTGERAAVSDKPWSQFSQADYTDEQWKAACLIVRGDAKSDCSLPIKEPDGTLNRNGVHAAASRLGQVQASSEEKSAAAKALVSAYATLGEDPPESLAGKRSADDEVDLDVLEAEAEAAMALLVQRASA